ncbi:autotransporter outer membrane beta-barrel domain-containing protein [Fusobacterium ulcerans]|uniref:autotransporter family protein n=1 Tax=Fusobacterium ulcerans TaxID=861 RepID=UPI0030973518
MIEKIMKTVKSGNKKRGRNITIGAVVGMLLSCTTVMGEDNYLWIRENSGATEFNTQKTTDKEGTGGNWNEEHPYSDENIWNADTKTYINNIILSSSENNGIFNDDSSDKDLSYGLRLSGTLMGFNFISNSSITATGGSYNFGIYNQSETMEDITNNGSIKAESTDSFSYGIYNQSETMEDITNNGLITVTIKGQYNSANGINNFTTTMGAITNNGLITATNEAEFGSASGINNTSSSEIGAITNNGLIIGTTEGQYGSASGINDASNSDITNTGIIYGKTCAVYKQRGTINNFNNYGLLMSQTGDTVSGGTSITNSYGLIFKAAGGSYTAKDDTDYGKFGTIATADGYTIINAKAEGAKDNITGTESLKLTNGVLTYYDSTKSDSEKYQEEIIDSNKKYILNGITDTLLVSTGENKLDNSVINAYGTAVKFDEANGGKLTLSGTTVNGGIDGISAAIFGSDDSSNTDALVLENSVVNGNIDMQSGTNTITSGNNTTINGDVKGGAGEDTFTSGNNVAINGKIELGDENNKITLGNNVYINGDIDMGTNGVNLTGGSEVYLNGKVAFTDNVDILTLGEKSVIVQDIAMKDGNDELTIGAGSIVNAALNGGDGTDTLTFGKNSVASLASITKNNMEDSMNISHDITGFENINVGTKVTFASDLSITGANNIALEKDGVLLLTLDKNIKSGEKLIGHALYNLGGTTSVSSTGGKILLDLDGATGKEIISFGNTNLESSIVPGDNETLDITSKVHTIKAGANPNEVVLVLRWSIPEILKYKGLNEVYHGIGSVNDLIGNFNIKSDEQLVTFIEYLNDIYAGNPYSYSSELSRKSAGMFRDIVVDNIFRPEKDKWMIYGGLTHVDGGTKDTYYGKGYYTYDIGSSDMDADSKITGAYMLGEYGVSDTLTSGIIIGGNKLKSDLSNGSKVDGSAMYLGAYAKKYIGNLKVTAGAGFQYGDYDADRMAVNKVASDSAESVMKYSDNYNDITYDIYLNGRYSNPMGNNLFLEPYATLSYTYIDQDGANEGSKALAIETDSKSFDYTVGKMGVDLKKVIPHEKGKSTLSAGVSYTKILDGADEEHITGRFKGGSDFDILVAHKNEHSIGLNAKYALELENGVIFDVKGTYSVERDSHNNSGKNKTKGEWIAGAGMGYKF